MLNPLMAQFLSSTVKPLAYKLSLRNTHLKFYKNASFLFTLTCLCQFACVLLLLNFSVSATAASGFEHRFSTDSTKTRVVFEFPKKVEYSSNINYVKAELNLHISGLSEVPQVRNHHVFDISTPQVQQAQYQLSEQNNIELKLQLNNSPQVKIFELLPSDTHGHRVIVDLLASNDTFHLMIDPSHGGVDLGTISEANTFEKDLSLQLAQALKQRLDQFNNIRVSLTRNEDEFVYPHQRREIVENSGADMLISLHAKTPEAAEGEQVSVWSYADTSTVSEVGQALVHFESEAILLGNVADVMNNLEQSSSSNYRDTDQPNRSKILRSRNLAAILASEINKEFEQADTQAQQTKLLVLSGKKVPSVAVNLGSVFSTELSNKHLNDDNTPSNSINDTVSASQSKLINSLVAAIHNYSQTNKKVSNNFINHIVQRGESMYQVSRKYNVTMSALTRVNKLKTDALQAGQILIIPITG